MVLVLRATIPDPAVAAFLQKKIAAIESQRLMYINREISFEIFLELTRVYNFYAPHFTLVKEALIEIGCVVTSLVVGCHARALWPNGAS